MRLIVSGMRLLLIAAVGLLSACDSYTAIKAVELGARAMTPKAPKPPETQMMYFQDAKTHLCFARADTKDAAGYHAGAGLTTVECTPEVLAQLKLQQKNWTP